MELTALLTSFIYLVSSSLLIPVLILLSISILWLVVYSGSFFGGWLKRRRLDRSADPVRDLREQSFEQFSVPVRNFIARLLAMDIDKHREVGITNLLRETEQGLWKSLDRLKIMVRIGPGLGLIGTLIPMGTGLAGLSQGDFNRLSGDLVIAFTTTVVGMALGLASYCFFTVQRRWVEEDLKNIELAADILIPNSVTHSPHSPALK